MTKHGMTPESKPGLMELCERGRPQDLLLQAQHQEPGHGASFHVTMSYQAVGGTLPDKLDQPHGDLVWNMTTFRQ